MKSILAIALLSTAVGGGAAFAQSAQPADHAAPAATAQPADKMMLKGNWRASKLMMQLNSDVEPESSGCLTNSGRQERLAA